MNIEDGFLQLMGDNVEKSDVRVPDGSKGAELESLWNEMQEDTAGKHDGKSISK